MSYKMKEELYEGKKAGKIERCRERRDEVL